MHGEKIDMLTYEENFLILTNDEGRSIAFGELDRNFAALPLFLESKLGGFDPHWYGKLELGPAGRQIQLWPKPSGGQAIAI